MEKVDYNDMSKEELIKIIEMYEKKYQKKKEYNRNYYKSQKGRESVKRSQKKILL